MAGSTFTYLLGSDAAALMFNSKNDDLNAEDVYSRLTTPVFGKGVAYDVPNPVSSPRVTFVRERPQQKYHPHFLFDSPPPQKKKIFLEQKKMFKTGLNIARFREHVNIIEAETIEYFKRWGDSGERSKTPSRPMPRWQCLLLVLQGSS